MDQGIEFEFVYDRLGDERRSQAYFMLVPEKARRIRALGNELKEGDDDQDRGCATNEPTGRTRSHARPG